MKQVGIFDAKTHLSSLVDEVEGGGEVVITRHGKPVAKLVRVEEKLSPEQAAERRAAIARIIKVGDRLKINATQQEIKAWASEGRH